MGTTSKGANDEKISRFIRSMGIILRGAYDCIGIIKKRLGSVMLLRLVWIFPGIALKEQSIRYLKKPQTWR
jgi:hypothetical protein